MSIYWDVRFVYFNGVKVSLEFKVTEYTSLVDLKSIMENLLQYSDNQKTVKLEYYSPSIDSDENIQFSKFQLKANEDIFVMWSTFPCYKTKGLTELDVKIARSAIF